MFYKTLFALPNSNAFRNPQAFRPGGTRENSPAFQRREEPQIAQIPQGRLNDLHVLPKNSQPLQRGVLNWIQMQNRFNGFGARLKTAEAVNTHSPHLCTPLKQGVNEKSPNELELISGATSPFRRTRQQFSERGIYSASTADVPVASNRVMPFAVGNLKRTEVRAPLVAAPLALRNIRVGRQEGCIKLFDFSLSSIWMEEKRRVLTGFPSRHRA